MDIRKTIILDIDETLVFCWDKPKFLDELKILTDKNIRNRFYDSEGQYDFTIDVNMQSRPSLLNLWNSLSTPNINTYWGLYRPHLKDFARFISNYFDNVIIWSAGIHNYVHNITDLIFKDLKKPKLILSREDCVPYVNNILYKPISHIQTNFNNIINLDLRYTLVVDDRIYNFMDNPANGILIPPYSPEPTLESLTNRSDSRLLELKLWLQSPEVVNSTDYRNLNKNNIFL
jgi:hypothetical protein